MAGRIIHATCCGRWFETLLENRLVLPKEARVWKTRTRRRGFPREKAPHQKNRIGWTDDGIAVYWSGSSWIEVVPTIPLHERFTGLNGGGD